MENDSQLLFKRDRDVTRSFVNAPSTAITYAVAPKTNEYDGRHHLLSRSLRRNFSNENDRLIPVYCDLIVDTVRDYDIFYPIARQTRKYFAHSLPNFSKFNLLPVQEICHFPRTNMNHVDELALSIDLAHDYEFTCQRLSSTWENLLEPMIKNVRFENRNRSVRTSNRDPFDRFLDNSTKDQQNEKFPVPEIQFDRFHPIRTENCSICIPTGRSTIHAYVVPTPRDLIENSTSLSATDSQRF